MVGAVRILVWKLRVFPSYLGFKFIGRMGQWGSSWPSLGTGRWDPALLGWGGMAKSDSLPGRPEARRGILSLKPVSANTSGPGPPMGRGRGLCPSVWGAGLGGGGMKDFQTPAQRQSARVLGAVALVSASARARRCSGGRGRSIRGRGLVGS